MALVLVCTQGALGGARVLFDQRTLAMIHGCVGPVFFSLSVALAVFTSPRWRLRAPDSSGGQSAGDSPNLSAYVLQSLALLTTIVTYLQIVLGASVRHIAVDAPPSAFASHLLFHVTVAGVLTLLIIAISWVVWTGFRKVRPLRNLSTFLSGLLLGQIGLGLGTWALKFAAPQWFTSRIAQPGYTIEAGGWLQTHIVTAHVAMGSLILVTSLALTLYSFRLLSSRHPKISESMTGRWGMAV
jgi:cytochrome c oxidase assembly protein subunit 15